MFNEVGGRFYLPLSEPDEAAWIYSGYYFNLYFLKFDFFHEDWQDYDAYDHLPLVKYIVGGTLFLKGYVFDSLDAKRMWQHIPMDKYLIQYRLLKSQIPENALPLTRLVIFTFAFLSVVLLYILLRTFYGILPAIVATSFLITNSIFLRLSTQTIADPVLLFFFTLFLLLSAHYLRSGNNIYIFLGFVLSSLAFITKLNGLILIFALCFILVIKNKFSISNYKGKLLLSGFVTFLLMSILLNPFFLNSGIQGLVKMFDHRITYLHLQQLTFPSAALLSIGDRLKSEVVMIFFRSSFFYDLLKVPLEFMMFLLGIYYTVRKGDLILLTVLVFFIIPTMSILPINWERYYYTLIPFICVIAGASLNIFKELKRSV
jgi:4-amino-4-deoxy-L-arabinose transferase-like glycosyltransferase